MLDRIERVRRRKAVLREERITMATAPAARPRHTLIEPSSWKRFAIRCWNRWKIRPSSRSTAAGSQSPPIPTWSPRSFFPAAISAISR